MANPDLTAALNGSLKLAESDETSPLREVTPDSVDFLFDEINGHLSAGMPEKITDEKLTQLVEFYRAQSYKWSQDQEIKKDKRERKKKETGGTVVDISLLDC